MPRIIVCGSTHIDVAWTKSAAEHTELFEVFAMRLVDLLERHPQFTYVLEQAWHLRNLHDRRRDLWERLLPHIDSGRLEIVGAMVSTAEMNGPTGEALVRNMQLGLEWVREHTGATVRTGWLVDTFGMPAQVPQILNGFEIETLMATRFGGNMPAPAVQWRSPDGSMVLLLGGGGGAKKRHTFSFGLYSTWERIDQIFDAVPDDVDVPTLVMPYSENEVPPSNHIICELDRLRSRISKADVAFGTPSEFFSVLRSSGRALPTVTVEMNPEFSGTYANRTAIRTTYRRVESLILDAERVCVLRRDRELSAELAEIWWLLCGVQFHDVYTGSGPTSVFTEVMSWLADAEARLEALMSRAFGAAAAQSSSRSMLLINTLPFTRTELVAIPWEGARSVDSEAGGAGEALDSAVVDGSRHAAITLPAFGTRVIEAASARDLGLDRGSDGIENGIYRLRTGADGAVTVESLADGRTIIDGHRDWVTVRRDIGGMQIDDQPERELGGSSAAVRRIAVHSTGTVQSLSIQGAYEWLPWLDVERPLSWTLTFVVVRGVPRIDANLRLDWSGEESCVYFKVATTLKTSASFHDVPFAVAERHPYETHKTAKGSWPAGRYVAVEEGGVGLGVVNTGAHGVKVSSGSIWTMLLRAFSKPTGRMVRDETTSQHGRHSFRFGLVPYAGSRVESSVHAMAEAMNHPLRAVADASLGVSVAADAVSTDPSVVLSGLKYAQDGSGDIIVRFYDVAGSGGRAKAALAGVGKAWHAGLDERPGAVIPVGPQGVEVTVGPYEIATLRLRV